MATFSERLIEALNVKRVTAAELARRIGVNEGTISNYKKGNYIPKQRRLEEIASALNVSIPYLMGFDVPMTPQPSVKPLVPQMSEDALHVAHQYEQLDAGDQGYIRGQLDLLLRADKYRKKENSVS